MTWSKVLLFAINSVCTSCIFYIVNTYNWDVKTACSVSVVYTLLYMLGSDCITSWDKKSSISKATAEIEDKRIEIEDKKNMIVVYERCLLDIHHCALVCITEKLKGEVLIYQLQFIITTATEVNHNARNKGNEYKPNTPKDDHMAKFIDRR